MRGETHAGAAFAPTVGVSSTHPSTMPAEHARLPVWNAENWFYEDFEIGDIYEHRPGRTVTEADNVLFTTLTMNTQALHLDAAWSATQPFGQRLVNSMFTLSTLVGSSVASELLLTGRFIDAGRALRVGLVSEGVADEALEDAARSYVEEMLATSPLGLRLTKECLAMSIDAPSLEAAVAMEDRNQILCTQTQDVREALAAFKEKRAPEWRDL